jgi:hypothetical protein
MSTGYAGVGFRPVAVEAVRPKPESLLMTMMNDLFCEITELGDAVKSLGNSLDPVLAQVPPSLEDGTRAKDTGSSPVEERLYGAMANVRELRFAVNDLRNRLRV